MKEVFRVTGKYWVNEEGFGTVLMLVGVIFCFVFNIKIGGVICLLMFLVFLKNVLKLRQGRVEIDETELRVIQGNETTDIRWSEVVLARLEENHEKPRKVLVTVVEENQQIITFNIEQYDHQRIWELTRKYVRPSALAPDAAHKLDGYQEWQTERAEQVNQIPLPFEIKDSWLLRGSDWVCFCMFGSLAWVFLDANDAAGKYFGIGLCLLFVLKGLYGILTKGKTVITQARIERYIPLGIYALNWAEIKYLEADTHGSFIFWGEDKYLYVFSPMDASRKGRAQYSLLLESQIEKHQIETRLTRKIRRFAKNTKVS